MITVGRGGGCWEPLRDQLQKRGQMETRFLEVKKRTLVISRSLATKGKILHASQVAQKNKILSIMLLLWDGNESPNAFQCRLKKSRKREIIQDVTMTRPKFHNLIRVFTRVWILENEETKKSCPGTPRGKALFLSIIEENPRIKFHLYYVRPFFLRNIPKILW